MIALRRFDITMMPMPVTHYAAADATRYAFHAAFTPHAITPLFDAFRMLMMPISPPSSALIITMPLCCIRC